MDADTRRSEPIQRTYDTARLCPQICTSGTCARHENVAIVPLMQHLAYSCALDAHLDAQHVLKQPCQCIITDAQSSQMPNHVAIVPLVQYLAYSLALDAQAVLQQPFQCMSTDAQPSQMPNHHQKVPKKPCMLCGARLERAQVVDVDAVVGGAKGDQVRAAGAELHAAHVGLGVDHCRGRRVVQAPQPHGAVVASRQEPRRVSLHTIPRKSAAAWPSRSMMPDFPMRYTLPRPALPNWPTCIKPSIICCCGSSGGSCCCAAVAHQNTQIIAIFIRRSQPGCTAH